MSTHNNDVTYICEIYQTPTSVVFCLECRKIENQHLLYPLDFSERILFYVDLYRTQNHKACENLPSLHVWWVRRERIIRKSCYRFKKNDFVTSRMTSQSLNGHTKWKNVVFPLIYVIQIVSEHLIGPLEESTVWIFPLQNSNFNY